MLWVSELQWFFFDISCHSFLYRRWSSSLCLVCFLPRCLLTHITLFHVLFGTFVLFKLFVCKGECSCKCGECLLRLALKFCWNIRCYIVCNFFWDMVVLWQGCFFYVCVGVLSFLQIYMVFFFRSEIDRFTDCYVPYRIEQCCVKVVWCLWDFLSSLF